MQGDREIQAWWGGFLAGYAAGRKSMGAEPATVMPATLVKSAPVRRPDVIARNIRRRAASGARYQPAEATRNLGWQEIALKEPTEVSP